MANGRKEPNGSNDKKCFFKQIKKTNPQDGHNLLGKIGSKISAYKVEVANALLHRPRKRATA